MHHFIDAINGLTHGLCTVNVSGLRHLKKLTKLFRIVFAARPVSGDTVAE